MQAGYTFGGVKCSVLEHNADTKQMQTTRPEKVSHSPSLVNPEELSDNKKQFVLHNTHHYSMSIKILLALVGPATTASLAALS